MVGELRWNSGRWLSPLKKRRVAMAGNVLWWWGIRSWTPWNGKIHEFLDDDRAGLAIVLEE
jgi:hypothetical protein